MTQHDLFVIIGKQAAVIENYKILLEKIQSGFFYEDDQFEAIKKANEFTQEVLNKV